MNLLQLQAFQEVMLTGSVTSAAQNIGRTQPAISAMIAGLERSLGYDLFERRGGRLHPVPEAHFLLSEASSILDHLNSLRQTMQGVGTLEAGHLKIACMPVHAEITMPRLISRFVKNRKDVTVSMVSQSSERIYERIASQRFDIGFAEVAASSPLIDVDELEMECICAVPADHKLATKTVITAADLSGEAMTSFLPGHFVRRELARIFEEEGLNLHIRFEVQNASAQYVFIEEGLACSVMSPLSAQNYRMTHHDYNRVVFIPFQPTIMYSIAVLTPARKPLSRLALAFTEILKIEAVEMVERGNKTILDSRAH